MKRRNFIRNSISAVSVPIVFQGQTLNIIQGNDLFKSLLSGNTKRKLVIINLDGGNDGLNMLIPLVQYQKLKTARPNIMIARERLLQFTDALYLHPAMISLKRMYDEKRAMVIQNVGYPDMNLSHFRSRDIISSASDSYNILPDGWLGRFFNDLYPDFNQDNTNGDPIAITIGTTNSFSTYGNGSNYSTVIKESDFDYSNPETGSTAFPNTPYGHELKFITQSLKANDAYLEKIAVASESIENKSNLYPQLNNNLAEQLALVARLIGGGLETQVYQLSLGGFDTHANQVKSESEPEKGTHADLLNQLADSIRAFQDDLDLMGVGEDVIGLVITEFGRRIKSNAQLGTDHGTVFPVIMFGTIINPATLGHVPQIPDPLDETTNLEMEIDIRSIYASIFKEWFEADEGTISQLLYGEFSILPILKTSEESTFFSNTNMLVTIYPNPATNYLYLKIFNQEPELEIELFNNLGQLAHRFMNQTIEGNYQEIVLPVDVFPRGVYVIRLRSKKKYYSEKIILKD